MTYDILKTGSSGNCTIVNGCVAIDMGISWRALERRAGALRLVLLTHEHGDHFLPATVRRLARERPGLRWACCRWMVGRLKECGVDERVIDVLEPLTVYAYPACGVKVMAEEIPHNVPNCAWHVFSAESWADALLYVTDCASLEGVTAKNYSVYLVEANHTRAEIEAAIAEAEAKGEFTYRTEAAKNHLSLEAADAWLARMMGPESVWVQMHRHIEREKRAG